jgi:hypothetical protein
VRKSNEERKPVNHGGVRVFGRGRGKMNCDVLRDASASSHGNLGVDRRPVSIQFWNRLLVLVARTYQTIDQCDGTEYDRCRPGQAARSERPKAQVRQRGSRGPSRFPGGSSHGPQSQRKAVNFFSLHTYNRLIPKFGAPQNYGPCAAAQLALLWARACPLVSLKPS